MKEWLWLAVGAAALIWAVRRFYVFLDTPDPPSRSPSAPRESSEASTPARYTAARQAMEAHPAARVTDGFVVYFANGPHGQADREYRFRYVREGNSWRAYILKMPSLGGRDASGVVTHRLYTADNKPYVCWDRPVASLSDMQTISKLWADSIQEYIATGKRFG